MARDTVVVQSRGGDSKFQIVLSRSFVSFLQWKVPSPFISALGVLVPIYKTMCRCTDSQNPKRRNEGGGFFYETPKQNNLEPPPRDWPTTAGHYGIGIGWFLPTYFVFRALPLAPSGLLAIASI